MFLGSNGNCIFFPFTGEKAESGVAEGTAGYWTSTISLDFNREAAYAIYPELHNGGNAIMLSYGEPVRPIKYEIKGTRD